MTLRRIASPRPRGLLLGTLVSLSTGAAMVVMPTTANAQQACSASSASSRAWAPPLDRIIPVRARNVALRDGIDRIAAAARFRISYSAAFLPLDKHVCLSVDSISAGDALMELLTGVSVSPIPTGLDHVVIAPTRAAVGEKVEPIRTLERVVVTGSATGNKHRPLSISLDVLDGAALAERGSQTLSASFDGNVAGLWLWEQGPASLLARYGSIRGASSFNVSYPKIYIDGIEVANPLLVTQLDPGAIARIEVIRGPQGAALYGSDAISGVVNIVTRHEGLQAGAARTEVFSSAGLSQTEYAASSVLAQNHSLNWRAGSGVRSGTLGMNLTTLGGYVPAAYSRDLKLTGGMRLVSSKASVTGTARFYGKRAAEGQNPLLRGFAQPGSFSSGALASRATSSVPRDSAVTFGDSLPQAVRQYTVGGSATLLTGGRWTPSITLGVDGYRMANVPNDLAPVPSALDSALHDARGGADRSTLRASIVRQFQMASRESLTITLAAEHSALRETIADAEVGGGGGPVEFRDVVSWRSTAGLVAQGNLAINNTFYVTSGFRIERNEGFAVRDRAVVLPMLGVAAVRDMGDITFKARGAFGVGIRPAQTATREMALRDIRRHGSGPALDPEEQSGTEVGADVMFGQRIGVHVTRFDQTASGLIQPVAVPRDSQPGGPGGGPHAYTKRMAYVLQNVGEISNHGWELGTSFNLDALSLSTALATVDSRVRRIARGYTGDLRPGDRMLAVPSATGSLSASWRQLGWFTTLTASRAFDWINYDRLSLAEKYADCDSCTAQDMTGVNLRSYWMKYQGVTRLRATFSRDLPRNLTLRLTADNLTNAQDGEPDNVTVLPGRTVLMGLAAKIR